MLAKFLAAGAALLLAGSAGAAIVNNGDGTFTDTATHLRWQDLNTFYGSNYATDQTLLKAGFSFASQAQVDQLEADTGLTAATPDATFISVAAAMGVPTPTPVGRELIWGMYGDGSSWAYIYGPESGATNWTDASAFVPSYPDEGAFAVSGGVPEPATWTIVLAGLCGLGAAMRSRRRLGAARI